MSFQHILSLMNSHIEGDNEEFLATVLSFAAGEARRGKLDYAEKLKKLVYMARVNQDTTKSGNGQNPIPYARPGSELQGLMANSYPRARLSNMVLSDANSNRLKRLVKLQHERAELRSYGKTPDTHILLVGPPGTGKTMTASALAGELRLPLFTLKLESLFSRYFGESAGKPRILFDQIAQTRGVYLLDEFDAIGANRSLSNDIGEVRRILNAVLAFMEEPNQTDSLVVAATNYVELMDDALARRFDETILYEFPDEESAWKIIQSRTNAFKLQGARGKKFNASLKSLSHGEIVMATDAVVKDAILAKSESISISKIHESLLHRITQKSMFKSRHKV